MRYANTLIIGILVVGSLVSAGAENTEPGDFLYRVKTEFNEPIRGLLTRSTSSKADWEAQLASRRLWEVEALALEGKLEGAHTESAIRALHTHLPLSRAYIGELLNEGNAVTASRIVSDLEATLTTHARILLRIGAHEEIAPLLTAVTDEARRASDLREASERAAIERGQITEDAEGRVRAAEENIRKVKAELNRRSSRLSGGNRLFAQGRITDAEALLEEAEKTLDVHLSAEAFRLAQSAYRRAEEALLLINSTILLRSALELEVEPESPSTSPLEESVQ